MQINATNLSLALMVNEIKFLANQAGERTADYQNTYFHHLY